MMRRETDGRTLEGLDVSVIVTKPGSCRVSNFNVEASVFRLPSDLLTTKRLEIPSCAWSP